MDRITADLRQLDNLDIAFLSSPIKRLPSRSSVSGAKQSVLKSALEFSTMLDSSNGCFLEPIKVREKPPSVSILLPTTVPVGMVGATAATGYGDPITLAVGASSSVFAIGGFTSEFGVYGSNSPELGLFASVGAGWWTNVGFGVGPAVTLIFGPPAAFAGVAFGIGCDTRFFIGSIGGQLLFSAPPFKFLGITVGFTIGPSLIPAFDVTVQVSNTRLKPLLR
jgi:hypothetical protein